MSFVLSAIKRGAKSKMSGMLEEAAPGSTAAADHSKTAGDKGELGGSDALEEHQKNQAATAPVDARQAEWDIMVRLLDLDKHGLNALTKAGINNIRDVELFGNGAAKEAASGPILIDNFTPMTRQQFQIIATYLLNDGKLTAASTLAQMARLNLETSVSNRNAGRPRKHPLPDPSSNNKDGPVVKRPRGRPRKNPLVTTYKKPDGVKRPVGRPRKYPLPATPLVKRPVGRPRKNKSASISITPIHTTNSNNGTKRSVGRPRKHALPMAAAAAAAETPVVKRPRGRPRKTPEAEVVKA